MKTYEMMEMNVDGYNKFIICLSSESLLDYIGEIEKRLSEEKKNGTVLVDQLFLTGDSVDRFMSCQYINGKLDFNTVHTVDASEYYKEKTAKFLHDNYHYVENSILTEKQREEIRNRR